MATSAAPWNFSCASARRPRARRSFSIPIEDYLFARGDDYVQKFVRIVPRLMRIDRPAPDGCDAGAYAATLIAVRETNWFRSTTCGPVRAPERPRQLIEINSIFGMTPS